MLYRKTSERWRHAPGDRRQPKPFPNLATFMGIAVALIVVWLLSGNLPKIMGWPEPPAQIEAGASQ